MTRSVFAPGLLQRDEAAYYLNLSSRKFNDLIQRGDVIAVRLDGKKLYRRADLDELIEALAEWSETA